MKRHAAWYAVWPDGTKWLGWKPGWVEACRRSLVNPSGPVIRVERMMILR